MKNSIKLAALSIALVLMTGCQDSNSRILSDVNQTSDKMILIQSLTSRLSKPFGSDEVTIYKKVCLDGKNYYASRSHTGYWIIGGPVMVSISPSSDYVQTCQ